MTRAEHPHSRRKNAAHLQPGDCARIPDGRIGRVREAGNGECKVRVRRKTSNTHQFLMFSARDLQRVECPKGWMSPSGYMRYLTTTLEKMQQRRERKK